MTAPATPPAAQQRGRVSAEAIVGRAALAGALAGAGVGLLDASWSWTSAAQFLGDAAARARFLVFCASTYALWGAALACAGAAAALALTRGTRLGDALALLQRAHQAQRQRDPAGAVAGLALTLAGLPAAVLAVVLAHRLAVPLLARRHPELVALSVLLLGVAALAAAALAALVFGRLLEVPLARLAKRPRIGRFVSSLRAPFVAAAALALGAAGWLLAAHWATARLLPLRPAAVIVAWTAAAVVALPLAARAARRAKGKALAWSLAGVLTAGWAMARCGGAAGVQKAAAAYTGLAGHAAELMRRASDRDGDGYSPWLSGGDCDDGDARVHPGAAELAEDGVDQNCLAGDARASAAADDLGWHAAALPVPQDANVLLLTIDTLRADHLGAYGYPRATSPALDRLAAEGTLFAHAWAHAPSTRYSMPAILTGRLPLDAAYDTSLDGWPGLATSAITLAEVLRAGGMVTGAITNYWYFDAHRGMAQGFDEYDNDNARLHSAIPGQGPAATRGSSSREQTDKAIAFVERHAGARWFLWVHYYDPHYEYEPHPDATSFGEGRVDRYDAEIRYTDDQIGRLFAALRQRGLYDKTIIAVTGDHGEGFGEHGVELHGYHLYAAQTKVPLIVRAPGLPPRRSATPAGHVDLLPTLANLSRAVSPEPSAPPPPLLAQAMGSSLADIVAGAPDRARTIWQQLSYEGNHELRGAVDARCHVIYNASPVASWEVYRIDRDPHETRDLDGTGECAETRRALAAWYDSAAALGGDAAQILAEQPALVAPLALELGEHVTLLEVKAQSAARPGETIELTWTFAARGEVAPGWKVFLHVEGPGRFTGDHAPPRPIEWWPSGRYVRYTTSLSVPASAVPGRYTLWAGLWQGARRMPARVGRGGRALRIEADRAAIGELEVRP